MVTTATAWSRAVTGVGATLAFGSQEELERCREQAGTGWDEDECYFVYEALLPQFPGLQFQPYSHCAGVLRLTGK